MESERSFLRDAQRFFSHLFPGVVGLHPSSLHRRVRKLRRFLEPLRRGSYARARRGPRNPHRGLDPAFGPAPAPGFSVGGLFGGSLGEVGHLQRLYGVKLHLLCSTNRVPVSYELTPANVAEEVGLSGELLAGAKLLLGGEGLARRLFASGTWPTAARR